MRTLSALILTLFCCPALAQGTADDYDRADRLAGQWRGLIRNDAVRVDWLDADTPVYRYTRADGSSEWRTVDLQTGEVRPAFERAPIERALASFGMDAMQPVWFDASGSLLRFMNRDDPRLWAWDRDTRTLVLLDHSTLEDRPGLPPSDTDRTRGGGPATTLLFVNSTQGEVSVHWLEPGGRARAYATLAPGSVHTQSTFTGHAWRVESENGRSMGVYEATEQPGLVFITPDSAAAPPKAVEPTDGVSPDGRWRVVFDDHQVVLVDAATSQRRVLTHDGHAGDRYEGPVRWSPIGDRFVVMQTVPGSDRTVTIIESAPADRLEPRAIEFGYRKPGDAVDRSRPRLFEVPSGRAITVDDAPITNPWSVDRIRWAADSGSFTYLYNERGHQRLRWVRVDARSGLADVVIEETSETFIDWTNKVFVHEIERTGEVLWMSERSGWNHLYLLDARSGAVINPITAGAWVVRSVERVDEEKRTVLLRVMGVRPGEDPYHIHFARVGLDGSGFTLLTEGEGTHRVAQSPDGRYLVDVWSRADLAPITEIRRSSDGSRVAIIAEGDTDALRAQDWSPPERFVAAGRDGVTPIWGLIHRPSNFDPGRRYPVIESIYAGPHGQHVPKVFSVWRDPSALAELGFVVVEIDGMGTNWRSKAFHDVAYKNLRDAGFPDRIAWMRSAASTRPWMDLGRVGIFGVSAGGQNALGAMLFHGDFYKAAVADCGCHDNRMDKIWWNEQWMGWPVDDSYAASSNAEHAHRLEGDLLLTVGAMDRNVDPSSTMQVVDALIRADKDFELIVFPGLGHGTIGSPYGRRRMRDFFVRTLLDVEPRRTPDEM